MTAQEELLALADEQTWPGFARAFRRHAKKGEEHAKEYLEFLSHVTKEGLTWLSRRVN
jgi:rubrerythrin